MADRSFEARQTELVAGGVAAFDDAVGVDHQRIAGLERDTTADEGGLWDGAQEWATFRQRSCRTVRLEQQGRGLAGVAVGELAALGVEAGEEERDQRRLGLELPQVVVDGGDTTSGVGGAAGVDADLAEQVGEPHAGGQSLADDVADGEAGGGAEVEHIVEVAGEVAEREHLAGNLEAAEAELARRAEAALDFGGFEEGAVEVAILTLQLGNVLFARGSSSRFA